MADILNHPLNDAQLDELDDFLLSDAVHEEALDYIALHGYLCGLAISPVPVSEQQWLSDVFAQDINTYPVPENIIALIKLEFVAIQASLESNNLIDLPCDLTLEIDEEGDCLLEYWAQGFIELVFSQEDAWFAIDETAATEMLLPFLLAANLDDNNELQDLRKQAELTQALCEQIPELLQDLFLHFRTP